MTTRMQAFPNPWTTPIGLIVDSLPATPGLVTEEYHVRAIGSITNLSPARGDARYDGSMLYPSDYNAATFKRWTDATEEEPIESKKESVLLESKEEELEVGDTRLLERVVGVRPTSSYEFAPKRVRCLLDISIIAISYVTCVSNLLSVSTIYLLSSVLHNTGRRTGSV